MLSKATVVHFATSRFLGWQRKAWESQEGQERSLGIGFSASGACEEAKAGNRFEFFYFIHFCACLRSCRVRLFQNDIHTRPTLPVSAYQWHPKRILSATSHAHQASRATMTPLVLSKLLSVASPPCGNLILRRLPYVRCLTVKDLDAPVILAPCRIQSLNSIQGELTQGCYIRKRGFHLGA